MTIEASATTTAYDLLDCLPVDQKIGLRTDPTVPICPEYGTTALEIRVSTPKLIDNKELGASTSTTDYHPPLNIYDGSKTEPLTRNTTPTKPHHRNYDRLYTERIITSRNRLLVASLPPTQPGRSPHPDADPVIREVKRTSSSCPTPNPSPGKPPQPPRPPPPTKPKPRPINPHKSRIFEHL